MRDSDTRTRGHRETGTDHLHRPSWLCCVGSSVARCVGALLGSVRLALPLSWLPSLVAAACALLLQRSFVAAAAPVARVVAACAVRWVLLSLAGAAACLLQLPWRPSPVSPVKSQERCLKLLRA